jgi:hypothetical protein
MKLGSDAIYFQLVVNLNVLLRADQFLK